MEKIYEAKTLSYDIKVVLFDFDGTISTLRYGWEKVMEPMMLEMIGADQSFDMNAISEIRDYIDRSTGIQTIYQMEWLSDKVERSGRAAKDPWWYKDEYNRRLMSIVDARIDMIRKGVKRPEDFLIDGIEDLLSYIKDKGIKMYAASGTDDPDVKNEAKILGVYDYFDDVKGAPFKKADCSKEFVLRELLNERGFSGPELLVIGDGKVEIRLGREAGALTLGVASDEERKDRINFAKRKRLIDAGAHAIVGDFRRTGSILKWIFEECAI